VTVSGSVPDDSGTITIDLALGDGVASGTVGINGVTVKILAPESSGAILLGGVASEKALARMRFYPDGTCDRVRLDITRNENRTIVPIDPLTCAPLPAIDAK
jgi:hypothetical protein